MKFNWGTGIFIFYVIFVLSLLFVLIASFSVDHSLVVEEYYQRDIEFQDHLDKKKNSLNTDNIEIKIDEAQKLMSIDFEAQKTLKGEILLYRPSSRFLDQRIHVNKRNIEIDLEKLKAGKWIAQIDWKADGIAYYKEETFFR